MITSTSDTTLTVTLPLAATVESVLDPNNYRFAPSSSARPISVSSATPITTTLQTGANASILGRYRVGFATGFVTPDYLNAYLFLTTAYNVVTYAKIVSIVSPTEVLIDKALVIEDPLRTALVPFVIKSTITSVLLTTNKPTNGGSYALLAQLQSTATGSWASVTDSFTASATRPHITAANLLSDGQLVVSFSEDMEQTNDFMDPRSFDLDNSDFPLGWDAHGVMRVSAVFAQGPKQVILETQGMRSGGWSISANDPRTITRFPQNDIATIIDGTNIKINELFLAAGGQDSTSMSDSAFYERTRSRLVEETLDVTDEARFLPLNLVFHDSLDVTEELDTLPMKIREINDALSITESINTRGDITLKEAPLTITEFLNTRGDQTFKETPLIFTETLSRSLEVSRFYLDTATTSDSVLLNKEFSRSLSDFAAFTEELGIRPTLTSLNYTLADTGGGDTITITGKSLDTALSVTVGGTAGTISSATSTSLQFFTPAKSAGTYSVVVTSAGGASNGLNLEFWDPSQITSINGYFDSRKGISSSGTDVLSWTDQVGGYVYSSSSGSRPTLLNGAFQSGSKVGVDFDGSQFLSRGTAGADGISVWWVTTNVVVSSSAVPNVGNVIVGNTGSYPGGSAGNFGWSNASGLACLAWTMGNLENHSIGAYSGAGLYGTTVHSQNAPGDPSSTTAHYYVNNVEIDTENTLGAITLNFTAIGAGFSGNNKYEGTVGAIMIVGSHISVGDRAKLYAWSQVSFL